MNRAIAIVRRYWLDAILIMVMTGAYIGLSWLGRLFEQVYHGATPFWPGAGLGLALVWSYGRRYAAVVVLGEFGLGLLLSRALTLTLADAAIALGEVLLAAECLTQLAVPARMRRVRDTGIFIALGAIVPSFLAAVAGAINLVVHHQLPFDYYWLGMWRWMLGDATGVLVVTPLIAEWRHGWPFRRWRQAAAWAGVTLATAAAGYGSMAFATLPGTLFFVLVPCVVLGAIVSGMRGATSVSAVLAACAFAFRLHHMPEAAASQRLLFVATTAITGYLLAAALSERGATERRLRHQAAHDALTGVGNRAALETALAAAVTTAGPHALCYLDLDHFKLLNDSRGHSLGDRFLAGLAVDIQAAVPPRGLVARLGGDEFAVLVPDTDADEQRVLAQSLRAAVQAYTYIDDALIYRVGVSIGCTSFGRGDQPSAALSRADIACYAAKAEGSNHIRSYRASDPEMRADHLEIQRVAQLHAALADGSFRIARQLIAPLQSDTTDTLPYYEILLRLYDTDGTTLSPGPFLDVAIRYGMMPIIDRWVVDKSFRYLASLDEPLRLSINLFGLTLSDPALYNDVMRLRDQYDIDPHLICFEVTEQAAIEHLTRAIAMMNRFIAAGFCFSLDDFGNGVASFGYLQELPVAYVKIDGRFVRDVELDPANPVIIESLVKLAALKKIDCIGEWIENEAILERMRALGVGYGQGFYLHRPEIVVVP